MKQDEGNTMERMMDAMARRVWARLYPDRSPWEAVKPEAQAEWVRMCGAVVLELQTLPMEQLDFAVTQLNEGADDTVKRPRLFFFEVESQAWCPVAMPEAVQEMVVVEQLGEGEELAVRFTRFDMTDREFFNLPEG